MIVEEWKGDAGDVDLIGSLKDTVWPEQSVKREYLLGVLQNKQTPRTTFLAKGGNTLAGFVDAFITTSNSGDLRWEVDLIAVHPHYQRRGIGKRLLQASTDRGKVLDVFPFIENN